MIKTEINMNSNMNYIKLICIACLTFISIEGLAQGQIRRPVKKSSNQSSQNSHSKSIKKYDYIGNYSEGLAIVSKNGKYGFINRAGKEVIPLIYKHAYDFSDGLAKVLFPDGKYGYIDKTGKKVTKKYDHISDVTEVKKYDYIGNYSEGLAIVNKNGKYGFIDRAGKEVIPLIYKHAYDFSDGLAKVLFPNGKYGYIDKTGKKVTEKYNYSSDITEKYDYISDYSEGLASVMKNKKWGYVDKTGREVIPLKFDYAENFSFGTAWVELNGNRFLINKNGVRQR